MNYFQNNTDPHENKKKYLPQLEPSINFISSICSLFCFLETGQFVLVGHHRPLYFNSLLHSSTMHLNVRGITKPYISSQLLLWHYSPVTNTISGLALTKNIDRLFRSMEHERVN